MNQKKNPDDHLERILSASRFTDSAFKEKLWKRLTSTQNEQKLVQWELTADDLEMAAGGVAERPKGEYDGGEY